jgi:hypothetical protein
LRKDLPKYNDAIDHKALKPEALLALLRPMFVTYARDQAKKGKARKLVPLKPSDAMKQELKTTRGYRGGTLRKQVKNILEKKIAEAEGLETGLMETVLAGIRAEGDAKIKKHKKTAKKQKASAPKSKPKGNPKKRKRDSPSGEVAEVDSGAEYSDSDAEDSEDTEGCNFTSDDVNGFSWPTFNEKTELGSRKVVDGANGDKWTIYCSRDNDTLRQIASANSLCLPKLLRLAAINPECKKRAGYAVENTALKANTLVVLDWSQHKGVDSKQAQPERRQG